MEDFARLSAADPADLEAVAIAAADALGAPDAGAAGQRLEQLAQRLRRTTDAGEQLGALRALGRARLFPQRGAALLLPDVLRDAAGDPPGVALALVAAGLRAGYPVAAVRADDDRLLVAHRRRPIALDPADGLAIVIRDDSAEWLDARGTVATVLREFAVAAERGGDISRALAASALLLRMPLGPRERAGQEDSHRLLLSRLN